MTFLASVLSIIIEWFLGQFETWIGQEYSEWKAQSAVATQAINDAAQLAAAKTAQDKINAANKINNDTFSNLS